MYSILRARSGALASRLNAASTTLHAFILIETECGQLFHSLASACQCKVFQRDVQQAFYVNKRDGVKVFWQPTFPHGLGNSCLWQTLWMLVRGSRTRLATSWSLSCAMPLGRLVCCLIICGLPISYYHTMLDVIVYIVVVTL